MIDPKIDRRELLQRAAMLLGGAVSASAMSGVLAGCVSSPETANQPKTFFNAEEARTFAAMADQIIPRTDTPGAIDAGVPAFADKMMAGFYQDKERKRLRDGLRQVATDAAELHGKPFADLPVDQQVAMMKTYDQAAYTQRGGDPHFFRMVKELTIVGFCTSEAGATKFLKYMASPGPYKGDIPYSQVGRGWAT